jgi:hypothetical protein
MPACSGVRFPFFSLHPPIPPQQETTFSQQVTEITLPSARRTVPFLLWALGMTWSSVRSSRRGFPACVFGATPQYAHL